MRETRNLTLPVKLINTSSRASSRVLILDVIFPLESRVVSCVILPDQSDLPLYKKHLVKYAMMTSLLLVCLLISTLHGVSGIRNFPYCIGTFIIIHKIINVQKKESVWTQKAKAIN